MRALFAVIAAVASLAVFGPAAQARDNPIRMSVNLPADAVCTQIVINGVPSGWRCTYNGETYQCTGERTDCLMETPTLTAPSRRGLTIRRPAAARIARW